jgi:hypothetical protein
MIMQPEDIGIIAEWWETHGVKLVEDILPTLGFCQWEHDELLSACFLCSMPLRGGPGGLVSWTIVNPDHMASALRTVNELLEEVKAYAKERKFVALMGTTNSRLLAKTYEDSGFSLGDVGVNQYMIRI